MFDFHSFPHTRFRMTLLMSNNLLIGEFSIRYDEHRYDVFPCSSGLPGHQTPLDYWLRGHGPIPPSIEIAEDYRLSIEPYYSAKVGGLFFHITPDPIISLADDQLERCEIGLHLDTHGPGTSGCEGIQDKGHFERISSIFETFRRNGTLFLPHHIEYLS